MAKIKKPKFPSSKRPLPSNARERLLEAASAIMREEDVIDAPVREIADRAGVNSALVRYYFGSKDGLRLAVFERDAAASMARHAVIMKSKLAPVQKLSALIREVISYNSEFPSGQRLATSIIRDADPSHAVQLFDDIAGPLFRHVEEVLTEGVATGVFRPVDPRHLYFAIVGACGLIFSSRPALHLFFEEKIDCEALRDAHAEAVASIILDGIRKPRRPSPKRPRKK
ncbi:MAG: TetR family transcriptional regulator [Hyphomonadaceae bacterium]